MSKLLEEFNYLSRRGIFTLSLIILVIGTGCSSVAVSTKRPKTARKIADFQYCEVDRVKQSGQRTCGLACLACVANYWEVPLDEKVLKKKYPTEGTIGYPMTQLKAIAEVEGLTAFTLAMKENPMAQLQEQIDKGRPVIVAVRCPQGRYFGKPIPIIETIDRRTIWNLGQEWKHHYVVVAGYSADEVLLMDPRYGIVRVGRSTFKDFWKRQSFTALLCASES